MTDPNRRTLAIATDGEVREIPVSMQVYQAVYNDITGKNEQINNVYRNSFRLTVEDLNSLGKKLSQFCEQFHIAGTNVSIAISHIKGRTERLSSFERLNTYNLSEISAVESVNLDINFLIILPKVDRPQKYRIKMNLNSSAAAYEKDESSKSMYRGISTSMMMRFFGRETISVTVEYVDYIVARGATELIEEWIEGLDSVVENKRLEFWQSVSNYVRQAIAIVFALLGIYFTVQWADLLFIGHESSLIHSAKFNILAFSFIAGLYIFGNFLGHRVENAIDQVMSSSYSIILFNKGDQNLQRKIKQKMKSSKIGVVKEAAFSIVTGIIGSVLATMLLK